MSQSIPNLINALGEAIAQQVADAEKHAAEAVARLEALRQGILSVFDGLNPPNLSTGTPATAASPKTPPSTSPPGAPHRMARGRSGFEKLPAGFCSGLDDIRPQ